MSKRFPKQEISSLIDQIRHSSRSVSADLSEAWRKRRYPAAFISKLSDAETEAAETQTLLELAVACRYLDAETGQRLLDECDQLTRTIVSMINHPQKAVLTNNARIRSKTQHSN